MQECRAITDRIGQVGLRSPCCHAPKLMSVQKLVDDKKKAVAAAHGGNLEKGHDIGKDLLSVVGELLLYRCFKSFC